MQRVADAGSTPASYTNLCDIVMLSSFRKGHMSATAELIVEQIRTLTKEMNEASDRGENVDSHKARLIELNKQLVSAAKALNESKQLLKG